MELFTITANATSVLSGVVTAEMMSGALNEVIALLPICIPPSITFIGIRKGINFLFSILHMA